MRIPCALPLLWCFLHLARSFIARDPEDGSICVVANVSAQFQVQYELEDGSMGMATFDLPLNASTVGTECGGGGRDVDLTLSFSKWRHTLSVVMNHNDTSFRGDAWHFVYNLGDPEIFPSARDKDIKVVLFESDIAAPLNTAFTCWAKQSVTSKHASVTLWNLRIQPYVVDDEISNVATHCKEDFPLTTPSTSTTATPSPATPSSVTPSSVTPSPGPANPSPSPTGPPPAVPVGSYNISVGNRSCLLAQMALQVVLVYSTMRNETRRGVFHVNPNATSATGSCGDATASLSLSFSQGAVFLGFSANKSTDKFYLTSVNVTLLDAFPDAPWLELAGRNGSLAMFAAPLGRSYSCASEQTVVVTPELELLVSHLHLQPFHVTKGRYDMAVECPQDAKQWIIPIVMGAALACLAVVVLTAYLYGQHKRQSVYARL
ncbi:lysosome-associated membrane glycoprotein 1-like isoform X2 [Lethenteron reissneri]|uniref:lysosome-associated membrane glycoprotein 1-like isoform X2 n=1 Tax=Lethenteron reissneri TaxID=7753 RepID=UPI002AB7A920|nr:lysosome-associated membrane glycoprotein 1-like isoform X2 [Lethenteron reissneri]